MKTLTLKKPIQLEKTEIRELKFRDYATAADCLAFDQHGQNQQTITLIANITGTDEAIIKRLHIADFKAADSICNELLAEQLTEKNAPES